MLIVHVFVHVKPDCVQAFQAASLENAQNSIAEPGIARFDVLQQQDDPTRFVLVEVFTTRQSVMSMQKTGNIAEALNTIRSAFFYYLKPFNKA